MPRTFSPLPTVLISGMAPLIDPTSPPPKPRAVGLSVPAPTVVTPPADWPVATPIEVPLESPEAELEVAPVDVAVSWAYVTPVPVVVFS